VRAIAILISVRPGQQVAILREYDTDTRPRLPIFWM
jgi:hypothetical protein